MQEPMQNATSWSRGKRHLKREARMMERNKHRETVEEKTRTEDQRRENKGQETNGKLKQKIQHK